MKWSELDVRQRSYLAARMQANDKAAIAAFVDLRKNDLDAIPALMALAVMEFSGEIKSLPWGSARGTRELQRKKVRALPMQAHRRGGNF